MDLTLIITVVCATVSIIAANITLIGWLRNDMNDFERELREWNRKIDEQYTDFHGRLCAMTEKINAK